MSSSQRAPCSSCSRVFHHDDLATCESCGQDKTYYEEVYCPDETDERRFNLSFFDPTVMQDKSHCDNCLVDCLFCEYSTCPSHTHSLVLPWFAFPLSICSECNDFNNKSFHFAQVLSGKVLTDTGTPIPDTVFEEVDRLSASNESFQHQSEEQVTVMTDEERIRYFQIKFLLYQKRNE